MSDPPLRHLVGQTALVTGSTRGIGRTIAEWLAREGANIVVSGRKRAAVEESATAMRALGVEAWGVPADLARVSEAHRLAEATLGLVPRLNILVNNAGMSIRGHVWEVGDAEWEEQVNVNFRSPFVLAQHAARHRIARGEGGADRQYQHDWHTCCPQRRRGLRQREGRGRSHDQELRL